MNTHLQLRAGAVTDGVMLRLDAGHSVAVYKRDGVCWVASFREGAAELVDAATWFRFETGSLRHSHRRRAAALQSATALTPEALERIERLHAAVGARDAGRSNPDAVVPVSLKQRCLNMLVGFHNRAGRPAERAS